MSSRVKHVARHTHPGLEMTYLLEGEATLSVDGRADQPMKAGDWFEVPADIPHSVQIGDKPGRALGHYVVEKDKPITAWLEEPADVRDQRLRPTLTTDADNSILRRVPHRLRLPFG